MAKKARGTGAREIKTGIRKAQAVRRNMFLSICAFAVTWGGTYKTFGRFKGSAPKGRAFFALNPHFGPQKYPFKGIETPGTHSIPFPGGLAEGETLVD
jgi:hypothetical protein